MYTFPRRIAEYWKLRRSRKRWKQVTAGLSCAVVVCTVSSLVLPAITLESGFYCGKPQHVHTESCYTKALVCPLEEGSIHTHGDSCYETQSVLVCGQEASSGHTHVEGCYAPEKALTCGREEQQAHTHGEGCYETTRTLLCQEEAGHTHGPSCYEPSGALVCGLEAQNGHVHTDECYQTTQTLICPIPETEGHTHSDSCYTPTGNSVLICGQEESAGHTHTDQCMEPRDVLVCSLEENTPHVHTDQCYETTLACELEAHTHTLLCQSNPEAVETSLEWESTLPHQSSGVWAEDLVAVAQSQLGYTQSEDNFSVSEDGETISGYYTRYGDWCGDSYGDWDAMFVSFCLHYAGIPQDAFPQGSDPAQWAEALSGQAEGCEAFDLYRDLAYTPVPGDLAFFGAPGEQAPCHVGIVTEYTPAGEDLPAMLTTIEGGVEGAVREVTREVPGPSEEDPLAVFGYAALPEQPSGERPLLCGKEAHTHTELCASPDPEGSGLLITCGKEEHIHTEACYLPQPREYRYEDETILVSVVLPAGSQVPEDASLRVAPITREEDRYSLLEQQAQEAAGGRMQELALYDVCFYTRAGEYLPVEESAAVTITFKQAVLSGDQVSVLHYGQEDAAPVSLADVEVKRDENETLSGLTFQTDGFSVFGVMTTQAAAAVSSVSSAVTLYPGQTYTADEVYTDAATVSRDIVDWEIGVQDNILKTGSDFTYSGARANASQAEYTFQYDAESQTFTASHDATCFNLSGGGDGCPSSAVAEAFLVLDQYSDLPEGADIAPIPAGYFALSTGSKCLFFHSNKETAGMRLAFETRNEVYNKWGCNLFLFKKDAGSTAGPIPGYVQVTNKGELEAGGTFLIAGRGTKAEGAGTRDDDIDGVYFVLYPNGSITNRYEHAAKVVPYKLTLTGKAAGTATVTAGNQTWTVTVNDQVTVEAGHSTSIQLPAGAVVTSTDEAVATVTVDDSGLATITGVAKDRSTTAAVTVGGNTYTWNIHVVKPSSFQLTYNGCTVTFHMVDKNDTPLEAEIADITGQGATKYLFAEDGAAEPSEGNVQTIPIPKIPGYLLANVTYANHPITFLATTGYSDAETAQVPANCPFRCYAAPTTYWSVESSAIDVYLNYMLPPVDTAVSPSGTVFNLFDYWVTAEDEGQVSSRDGNSDKGINQNHALKFTSSGTDDPGNMNVWTGDKNGALQELVDSKLGADGYPSLSGKHQQSGSSTESLAYLFDPQQAVDCRTAYRNVGGLLQVDGEGYYYYDSTVNFAEFDRDTNNFTLYQQPAVTHGGIIGQFFPFDSYRDVKKSTPAAAGADAKGLNHFFGMSMTTRFIQQYGGHTKSNPDSPHMTFEFSGDDDVWIFIDGVLVADLGGIHDPVSVLIDFADGTVTISNVYNKRLNVVKPFTEIFPSDKLEGETLRDNSYHTMNFYYLERGGYASNLHLKYNLVTFPASGITKVDQVGSPIPGVEFALYAADKNYNAGQLVCSGPTNSAGEFVFTDQDGLPLHLENLKDVYDEYYVLKEEAPLPGYRGTGTDIHLRIVQSHAQAQGEGAKNMISYVMVCENTTDSGAWASPSLQVTAPSQLQLDRGADTVDPSIDPGQLFAIVLKYIGPSGDEKDLQNNDNWTPVYGSAAEGYTVLNRAEYPSLSDAVAEAAQHYPGKQNYFHLASSGNLQALIEDLPGSITSYNFMAGNENISEIQYIVSFYWTDENGTTTRVKDYTDGSTGFQFTRTFGTAIQVPNMVNRIAVQKLDKESGVPLNGAEFAMYQVEDTPGEGETHTDGDYYFVSYQDSTPVHLYLEPDQDENYSGQARRCTDPSGSWPGTYSVDQDSGVITVTMDSETYTISPVQLKETVEASRNNYKENGIAEFERMSAGKYIIREITAPTGYTVNPRHILVRVTDNAIYANAGTAGDGVTVSRGPGYLAGNLHYYASRGDIDNTLSWVYSQMKVSGVSESFQDITAESYSHWSYLTHDAAGGGGGSSTDPLTAYLQFSPGGESTRFSYELNHEQVEKALADNHIPLPSSNIAVAGRRLTTDTGWSYLEIYQNYDYGLLAKNPNAEYADWRYVPGTQTPDELSNLFSRSVYVHVTDEREPGDLEISKTVVLPAGTDEQTEQAELAREFAFTVTLTHPDQPVDGVYQYTVFDNSNPDAESRPVATDGEGNPLVDLDLTFTGGTATLPLKHGQSAVIQGIPGGTSYEITETVPPKYITTAVEKVVADSTYPDGRKSYTGAVVSGPMYWHVEDGVLDSHSKVDFTNTYDPALDTVTITIRKVNAEDQSARLAGAEFALTRTDRKYHSGTGWAEGKTALTTNHSGEIQFPLMEDGVYTLTEEKAPDGYYRLAEPIQITMENGAIKTVTMGGKEFGTVEDNGLTLIVPNSTGYELPQSGGTGTAAFYAAGFLLLLAAALLLSAKRRLSAEQ